MGTMSLDSLEPMPRPLGRVLDETLERMARRARGEETPIPLPWSNVAEVLGGGFWGGTLVTLMGDRGSGKTQWAVQAAAHAAAGGVPVCYVTLESSEEQIATRVLALEARCPWPELYIGRSGRARIEELKEEHAAAMRALPVHVVEGTAEKWSYHNVRNIATWMRARYAEDGAGARPVLIVVDFAQMVSGHGRDQEPREVIERLGQEARTTARDFDAVVLLLSSTSRESDPRLQGDDDTIGFKRDRRRTPILGRGNPAKIARTKDPADLEQRSDTVLVLSPEQRSERTWCAVAKNSAGSRAWCALRFDGSRFEVDAERSRPVPDEALDPADAAPSPEAAPGD
jgi:replicative DNA helicase